MSLPLFPSNSNRWMHCAASIALSKPYKELYDRGEAAEEGVAAHEVIQKLASGEEAMEGQLASNNVLITKEMIEGAEIYFEEVGRGATFETKVSCDLVSKGMVAKPDAYRVDRDSATVFLWDYKFGHRPVDAFENEQMLVEAAAFLQHEPIKFVFTIVQPRNYRSSKVSRWELSSEEYINEYLPKIRLAAQNALEAEPTATTGKQCAYCPARHACTALQEVAYIGVDLSMQGSTFELSGDALGRELTTLLDAQERISARLTGLEAQALSEIEKGKAVRGFEVSGSYGNKTWTADDVTVFAIGDLAGVDLRKPSKPITPSQAIKAGVDKKTVEAMSDAPFRGYKLNRLNIKKLKGKFK